MRVEEEVEGVISSLVGFEYGKAFGVGRAVENKEFKLFRSKVDSLSKGQFFDSVGSANVDIYNWSFRFLLESVDLLLNWHVPGKKFPNSNRQLALLKLFITTSVINISQSLVNSNNCKSVWSQNHNLGSVVTGHTTGLLLFLLLQLLNKLVYHSLKLDLIFVFFKLGHGTHTFLTEQRSLFSN